MQNLEQDCPRRQGVPLKLLKHEPNQQTGLSSADRGLLLRSTLCLFLKRLRRGIPVTGEDLGRLVAYGDSDSTSADNIEGHAA
jgi:hypothetical protein